jgi:hypoxanthine phosphoribosyltransferase
VKPSEGGGYAERFRSEFEDAKILQRGHVSKMMHSTTGKNRAADVPDKNADRLVTHKGETLKKLFDEDEIGIAVRRLAATIAKDFEGEEVVLVSVLKGSFMFTSDLAREMKCPVVVDFLRATSYGTDRQTSGTVTITKDLETNLEGKNVVIVEDIIDSGLTLTFIRDMLLARRPRALKICALIDKKARRQVEIEADYVGFDMEDGFVVGYGIDYAERYRNLPAIFVVEEEK